MFKFDKLVFGDLGCGDYEAGHSADKENHTGLKVFRGGHGNNKECQRVRETANQHRPNDPIGIDHI